MPTSSSGRLLLLELCPGVVELGEYELGDVLVVGAHLLVGVHGQARLPVHLLDVVVSDQLKWKRTRCDGILVLFALGRLNLDFQKAC